MRANTHRGGARHAGPRSRSSIRGYLLAAAIVLPCIALAVAVWLLVFSPFQRQWVQCTVESAHGGTVHSRGRKPAVLVQTSDCGQLVYRWKVSKDNRDAIARQFQPGEPYDFLMAPVDRWLVAHPNHIFDGTTVWKYRKRAP